MKYLTTMVLGLFSSSIWAAGGTLPGGTIPEPETLFLIGVGIVALMVARSKRK